MQQSGSKKRSAPRDAANEEPRMNKKPKRTVDDIDFGLIGGFVGDDDKMRMVQEVIKELNSANNFSKDVFRQLLKCIDSLPNTGRMQLTNFVLINLPMALRCHVLKELYEYCFTDGEDEELMQADASPSSRAPSLAVATKEKILEDKDYVVVCDLGFDDGGVSEVSSAILIEERGADAGSYADIQQNQRSKNLNVHRYHFFRVVMYLAPFCEKVGCDILLEYLGSPSNMYRAEFLRTMVPKSPALSDDKLLELYQNKLAKSEKKLVLILSKKCCRRKGFRKGFLLTLLKNGDQLDQDILAWTTTPDKITDEEDHAKSYFSDPKSFSTSFQRMGKHEELYFGALEKRLVEAQGDVFKKGEILQDFESRLPRVKTLKNGVKQQKGGFKPRHAKRLLDLYLKYKPCKFVGSHLAGLETWLAEGPQRQKIHEGLSDGNIRFENVSQIFPSDKILKAIVAEDRVSFLKEHFTMTGGFKFGFFGDFLIDKWLCSPRSKMLLEKRKNHYSKTMGKIVEMIEQFFANLKPSYLWMFVFAGNINVKDTTVDKLKNTALGRRLCESDKGNFKNITRTFLIFYDFISYQDDSVESNFNCEFILSGSMRISEAVNSMYLRCLDAVFSSPEMNTPPGSKALSGDPFLTLSFCGLIKKEIALAACGGPGPVWVQSYDKIYHSSRLGRLDDFLNEVCLTNMRIKDFTYALAKAAQVNFCRSSTAYMQYYKKVFVEAQLAKPTMFKLAYFWGEGFYKGYERYLKGMERHKFDLTDDDPIKKIKKETMKDFFSSDLISMYLDFDLSSPTFLFENSRLTDNHGYNALDYFLTKMPSLSTKGVGKDVNYIQYNSWDEADDFFLLKQLEYVKKALQGIIKISERNHKMRKKRENSTFWFFCISNKECDGGKYEICEQKIFDHFFVLKSF